MAHRLTAAVRNFDRILKNGLFTLNLNNLAQVQPRHSKVTEFIYESSVCFPHDPRKIFDRPVGPKKDSNGGGAKTEGTSAARKAPNQGSKSDGNGGEGGDRKKNSRGYFLMEVLGLGFFIISLVYFNFDNTWCRKSYEEITWRDFAENYLARGRVAKVEIMQKDWLKVHIAPDSSADGRRRRSGLISTAWINLNIQLP